MHVMSVLIFTFLFTVQSHSAIFLHWQFDSTVHTYHAMRIKFGNGFIIGNRENSKEKIQDKDLSNSMREARDEKVEASVELEAFDASDMEDLQHDTLAFEQENTIQEKMNYSQLSGIDSSSKSAMAYDGVSMDTIDRYNTENGIQRQVSQSGKVMLRSVNASYVATTSNVVSRSPSTNKIEASADSSDEMEESDVLKGLPDAFGERKLV